jgi:DNA modification methylase
MKKLSNTFTSLSAPKIIQCPIADLIPDPNNARLHEPRQINLLAKSIQAFGFNVPVLVDAGNHVLAGHGRLLACQKLGILEVPTISLAHLTPAQAKAFMLADNRLTEIAKWDEHLLATQLKELSIMNLDFDLEATGFTIGEIDLRIEGLDNIDDDVADELPLVLEGPVVSQLGDLWLLGEHRLYCGNAQASESFEQLMDSMLAGMVITDPPYNVKVQGHVGGKGKIKHQEFEMASGEMTSVEFTQFLKTTFNLLAAHSIQGSVHSIFMDWRHLPEIITAGQAVYSAMLNMCVWVKNQAGMGSLYRSQHELALIYKNGTTSHQNNVQLGRFGRYRTNVWNYGGIQTMRHGEEGDLLAMHPTVKPTQMIADAILDCSKRNDIILDPFLGSGTTLLACERVGRRCYGMELAPSYVDTAIRRWQMMTGQEAVQAFTGVTFAAQSQRTLLTTSLECSHV